VYEVRLHGRGGQGVVTAAELLAVAAYEAGRWAQAFPSFGSERTGAPVVAYCRLDHRPIRTREPVVTPDAVVVLDPTLVHQVDLFSGLHHDGWVLVNTTRTFAQLGLHDLVARYRGGHLVTVPATELAQQHLGRSVPNAAMLGAFAAMTGQVSLEGVAAALRERFTSDVAAGNVAAATEAYDMVAPRSDRLVHPEMLGAAPD
jgi:pyruvate ferredoxin oxidoreductase gamma subunit